MARVELPVTVLNSSTGLPVSGASVQITYRSGGANAPWYTSESGGTASTAAVITDANGRASAWVARGAYNLTISGVGIVTYTEPWDAAPSSDASVDTLWLPDGAVTGPKIADGAVTNVKVTDLDASKLNAGTLPAARIGTGSITGTHIADGSVGSTKIVDGAVGTAKMAANSITTALLAAGTATRLLAVIDLAPYDIVENGAFELGTATIMHNGFAGYVLYFETAYYYSGAPAASFTVELNNVVVDTYSPLMNAGDTCGIYRAYQFGALSGSQNWSINATSSSSIGGVRNAARGLAVILENY